MSERTRWTPELDDAMLNDVLAAQTQAEYQRALVRFAVAHNIGEWDGDAVRRHLWGLATWTVEYVPALNSVREIRTGMPWTYGELRVLKWAFGEKPKQAAANPSPTDLYVARILNRLASDVREKRGITKPGKGFGIV